MNEVCNEPKNWLLGAYFIELIHKNQTKDQNLHKIFTETDSFGALEKSNMLSNEKHILFLCVLASFY